MKYGQFMQTSFLYCTYNYLQKNPQLSESLQKFPFISYDLSMDEES